MTKPETVTKFTNSLVDKVCDGLAEVHSIRKDAKNIARLKVSAEDTAKIRTDALQNFRTLVSENIQNTLKEESVGEKLETLRKLHNVNACKSGWRPTGDPSMDTFGTRRPLLIKHLSRLENLQRELTAKLLEIE